VSRVLVTGAPGYVGAATVRALVEQGDEVIALVQPGTSTERLADLPTTRLTLDLEDAESVERRLGELGPEAVVHAAWYANPKDYLTSPASIASLRATTSLFQAAARAGCRRFVGVGSCLEYASSSRPRCEQDPCEPRTLYASCKLAAWLLCRALAAQTGMSAGWARLFYLYGPDENSGRLLPDLVAALRAGRPFAMTVGTQVRDYLHVQDVGRALAVVCKHPVEGVVNIGSGLPTSLRDFAATVASILGAGALLRIGALPTRQEEEMFVVADATRLHSLGFRPKHASLQEGLEHALKNWRTA
jgi:nucleoside-diphosphate-sugar epimerase